MESTRVLVNKFRELVKTGDSTQISLFLDSHQDNPLFRSLVDLREALIPALLDKFKSTETT